MKRNHFLLKVPDLPPLLCVREILSIFIPLSTDLHISYIVKVHIETAVRASISIPVLLVVLQSTKTFIELDFLLIYPLLLYYSFDEALYKY